MKHMKCGTPECCQQCDPMVEKIRSHWPAAKAAIVEKLYTGGMKEAQVSTKYMKENFPELGNVYRGTYRDRISYLLLQPDLFPETLCYKATWKVNSEGESIYEQVS